MEKRSLSNSSFLDICELYLDIIQVNLPIIMLYRNVTEQVTI